MGMFSSPSFPKRPKQEGQLFAEGQAMQTEATGFASGMRARLADIANTTDERQRTARVVSGDMWQADAGANDIDITRPGATGLARALGRGKALTRMAMAGEQAIEGQALRDRMAMAKTGMGLRTGNVRDLFQLSQANDNFNAAKSQADQTRSGAQMNLLGTAVGMAGGWGYGKWQDRQQLMGQMAAHGAERV